MDLEGEKTWREDTRKPNWEMPPVYWSRHSHAAARRRCSVVLVVACGLRAFCDPALQVLDLTTQVLDPLVAIDHHVIQVLDGFLKVCEQHLQLINSLVDLLAGRRGF